MAATSDPGTVTVTHCDNNGTWLIALEGEHDVSTAPLLEELTRDVWPQCTVAVVDLSAAGFIDSGVIRWLMDVERELEALGAFTLSIVEGPADSFGPRILSLLGVREVFACYATLEEALAQAPAGTGAFAWPPPGNLAS